VWPKLYLYDANGNSLTDPSGKQYTWDFENRLVSTTVPGTGTAGGPLKPSFGLSGGPSPCSKALTPSLAIKVSPQLILSARSPSQRPHCHRSFFITNALCPPSQTPLPCHAKIITRSRQRSVCPPPETANRSLTFRFPEQGLTNRPGRNSGPTTGNRSKTRKSLFRDTLPVSLLNSKI